MGRNHNFSSSLDNKELKKILQKMKLFAAAFTAVMAAPGDRAGAGHPSLNTPTTVLNTPMVLPRASASPATVPTSTTATKTASSISVSTTSKFAKSRFAAKKAKLTESRWAASGDALVKTTRSRISRVQMMKKTQREVTTTSSATMALGGKQDLFAASAAMDTRCADTNSFNKTTISMSDTLTL